MKHTTPILLVLTIVTTYSSCKKSGNAPSHGSGKSDSTTSGNTGTKAGNGCLLTDRYEGYDWIYTYNPDKSVSEIAVQQTFSYPFTALFSYAGDSTVITSRNANTAGMKTITTISKNTLGQVTQLFYESFDAYGNGLAWTNFAFQYSDQSQNPTLCTMTADGMDKIAFFNYTYSNGNLTSIYAGPGTTFALYPHAMSFTYDQNTPAVQADLFWDESKFGNVSEFYYQWGIYNALYPVQNKNILMAQTFTDSLIHTTTAAYTFDGNKNIISTSLTTNPHNVLDSLSYHYSCSN